MAREKEREREREWGHVGRGGVITMCFASRVQGFMTGALQSHARRYQLAIDTLSFGYNIKSLEVGADVSEPPVCVFRPRRLTQSSRGQGAIRGASSCRTVELKSQRQGDARACACAPEPANVSRSAAPAWFLCLQRSVYASFFPVFVSANPRFSLLLL